MYTIKEASAKVKMSPYTLRYYERAGILPKIVRTPSGNRRFSDADIQWIEMVHCLRSTGMSIARIKRYVDLAAKDDTIEQRRQMMLDHKQITEQKIADLVANLQQINNKIDYYNRALKRPAC